jgi:hypothetical protein
MSSFDHGLNMYMKSGSILTSLATGLVSLFAGKIAPQLPHGIYRLLDEPLVQIVALAILVNTQLQNFALALATATAALLLMKFLVAKYAPDTRPISEMAKPESKDSKKATKKSGDEGDERDERKCYCLCNSTLMPPGL